MASASRREQTRYDRSAPHETTLPKVPSRCPKKPRVHTTESNSSTGSKVRDRLDVASRVAAPAGLAEFGSDPLRTTWHRLIACATCWQAT